MPRPFCVVVAILLAACPSARAADAPRRPEAQQEYWAQVDRKDWSAAVAAAEQLVTTARDSAAQHPLALAEALSLLGNAQYGAKDYIAAEKAFTESLQTVEQHAGAASPRMLDPLRGLGYTLAASGKHKEAVPPLERALLIDRRSFGLYDVGQQNVLRQLAESLFKIGRIADAERHVTYLEQLGQRVYGRRDPRQVPILSFVGAWRADIGDFISARATTDARSRSSSRSWVRTIRRQSSRCGRSPRLTRKSSCIRRWESGPRAASGCRPTPMAATTTGRSTHGTWAAKARKRWSVR